MFPTRLNLLSPEKRSYLQRLMYGQFIKNSIESLLLILCVSGIMLLGAEWTLQGYFNDLSASLATTSKVHAEKNLQIKRINHALGELESIQRVYTLWTPLLLEIIAAIPPGVVLTSITADSATGDYLLAGEAATRDDLLTMQTNLEALDFIDAAPIPLSQLTAREHVSFSLTAAGKRR